MKVHIKKEGFGRRPAFCGVLPKVMIHGGPMTATCKTCLKNKISIEWGNECRRNIRNIRNLYK